MAETVLTCKNLDATLAVFVDRLGFRLLEIWPADEPRVAVVESRGVRLRLERAGAAQRADGDWVTGRAGMRYRDLVPGRLGGRLIASHIQIPDGGPVPDYVHHHAVWFQMIFCYRGWVRVVYQDQGPPFVLQAGDCVLQPPGIRHRVLEASPGLEVIELGSPAEHPTFVDHELELPTATVDRERRFGGQRFVRHIAAEASWGPWHVEGFEARDLGIEAATGGTGIVRVARAGTQPGAGPVPHEDRLLLLCALEGAAELRVGEQPHSLGTGEAVAVAAGVPVQLERAGRDLELLELSLPDA